MNIAIRQGTLQDLDAVTMIESICFPPAEGATRDSLRDRLAAFTTSFLVAELDGQLIGFINGCITNQDTLTDDLYESTAKHDLSRRKYDGLRPRCAPIIPASRHCPATHGRVYRSRKKAAKEAYHLDL